MNKIVLLIALLFNPLLHADDQAMSYGWHIPKTPFYIGGYFSLKHEKELWQFDDIAFLFYANYEKFHILSEIESSDVVLSQERKEEDHTDLSTIHIERMRVDYDISDEGTIRIGKFNSIIGYWNQIPINILEDSSTEPNIMEHLFPNLTTGLAYLYDLDEGDVRVALILQPTQNLDKNYNNMLTDRHYALNIKAYKDSFSWSLSGGYFRELDHSHAWYAGVGIQKETNDWTLQTELFSKSQTKDKDIPYDGYMQATWHMLEHHDIVLRAERYKDQDLQVTENIFLSGYTYRPRPWIAIKGEYIYHSVLEKSRSVISFSLLF